MSSCSVKYCKAKSSKDKKISFFRLPSDPVTRKLWIENCNLHFLHQTDPDIVRKNYRICALHFEDRMFLNPSLKNRVKFNAIPTLFSTASLFERGDEQEIKEEMEFESEDLCPTCLNPVSEQKPNIMPSYDDANTFTVKCEKSEGSSEIPFQIMNMYPKEQELLNEIEMKNQELSDLKEKLNIATQQLTEVNTVQQMLKLCKLHLSPTLFLFVKTHINHRNKKIKDLWYCEKILDLAQTLKLLCPPNIYQFLQTILPLPASCVLKRISNMKTLPAHSDFDD